MSAIIIPPSTPTADTLAAVLAAGRNGNGLGITNLGSLGLVAPVANAALLTGSGYSLTGSSATSMFDLAGTLNTSGNPVVFKLALTDTASGGTTKFIQILGGAAATDNIFSLSSGGEIRVPGDIYTTAGGMNCAAAGIFSFSGRAQMRSPANGVIRLNDWNDGADFDRLCFGNNANTHPALKRNAASLQCKLGDDSALTTFEALSFIAGGTAGLASFSGAITNITIKGGIVTAAS